MDVLRLADVFENFVESSTREYNNNSLYSYSLPGCTWKAGLKLTNKKLYFINDKHLLLLLKNDIRGEFQVLWVKGMLYRMSINKSYTLMQIIYMDWL